MYKNRKKVAQSVQNLKIMEKQYVSEVQSWEQGIRCDCWDADQEQIEARIVWRTVEDTSAHDQILREQDLIMGWMKCKIRYDVYWEARYAGWGVI